MSIDKIALRNWAWDNCLIGRDTSTLLVALALVEFTFPDSGYAHVGLPKLEAKTGLSTRTIQGSIARLEAAGAWRVERNHGHASKFIPVLSYTATPAESAPPQNLHPRNICTPPPQNLHPTPAESAPIKRFLQEHSQDSNPATAHAADGTGSDDALFDALEPVAAKTSKPKNAPKAKVQNEQDKIAWAITSKAINANGGMGNRNAIRAVVAKALAKGYTPEAVEATALALIKDGKYLTEHNFGQHLTRHYANATVAAQTAAATAADDTGIDWDAFLTSK